LDKKIEVKYPTSQIMQQFAYFKSEFHFWQNGLEQSPDK